MTVRVPVAPDMLAWAVRRAGWDTATTLRRIPQYSTWLSGQKQPTLNQLQQFADATHVPFGQLFLSEPPVETVPIPDMRTLRNDALRGPSADLLDTLYLCQDRQEWYREFADTIGVPALDFYGSLTIEDDPQTAARILQTATQFELSGRSRYGSWEAALRQLIDNIEQLGILVMVSGIVGSDTHRALNPKEFRGFTLGDPKASLIFVNGADTKAAQIFTLMHETAHLLLGHSALSDASMTAQHSKEEEEWCNAVAAEALVPLAAVRVDHVGDPTIAELERLARKYRVSTLVVLKRIFDAGMLSWDDYYGRYEDELSRILGILAERGGGSTGGNYYYTQPLRLSRQFARAVISSTLEGSTAFREAYRLLGTKKHATFEHLAQELGVA